MKELSIEEKAKAYDEAIERANKWRNAPNIDKMPTYGNRIIEEIFPELKESEDERIRKELLAVVNDLVLPHEQQSRFVAWLEKQGEQKPADKIEPRFHEDEWVVISTTNGDRVVQIASVEYFKDGHPMYITTEGRWFGDKTKARLLNDVKNIILLESEAIKSKSWSEEDKTILNNLIYALANDRIGNNRDEYVEWLKSLKDRYAWKPSDEQMDVMQSEVTAWTKGCSKQKVLESLYNDLKKLRKE